MQIQSVSSTPTLIKPPNSPVAKMPTVSSEDIDWAIKLDKKMVFGYVPSPENQARYNDIISRLNGIKDGGGYVYKDTTSFSNNPRGIAAIGSMVGRTLSGGYIGYKYSHDVAGITKNTYDAIKLGIGSGKFGQAFKGLAVGLKDVGVISLKAGGISSAINAGTSAVANAAEVMSGRQTGAEAVGNVTSDTVGGFLSGMGATVFSGISTLGLGVAGVAGTPLIVAGVAGGAVGSVLTDMLFKSSGLFTVLKNKVMLTLGGKEPQLPDEPKPVQEVQATTPNFGVVSQLTFAVN